MTLRQRQEQKKTEDRLPRTKPFMSTLCSKNSLFKCPIKRVVSTSIPILPSPRLPLLHLFPRDWLDAQDKVAFLFCVIFFCYRGPGGVRARGAGRGDILTSKVIELLVFFSPKGENSHFSRCNWARRELIDRRIVCQPEIQFWSPWLSDAD